MVASGCFPQIISLLGFIATWSRDTHSGQYQYCNTNLHNYTKKTQAQNNYLSIWMSLPFLILLSSKFSFGSQLAANTEDKSDQYF